MGNVNINDKVSKYMYFLLNNDNRAYYFYVFVKFIA